MKKVRVMMEGIDNSAADMLLASFSYFFDSATKWRKYSRTTETNAMYSLILSRVVLKNWR